VTAASAPSVQLTWTDKAANETGFRIERSTPATGWTLLATVPANATTFTTTVELDTPTSFRVRANGVAGNSAFSNVASITVLSTAPAPCTAGAENLCLLGGRFRVAVRWRIPDGRSGSGMAVPDSDLTGLFWFFSADNIELIVKVLDGRPLTPNFWVFYGGLSNVEYWIVVADTQTGATKTYHNDQGNLCGNADVSAFPAPSVAPSSAAASLKPLRRPVPGGGHLQERRRGKGRHPLTARRYRRERSFLVLQPGQYGAGRQGARRSRLHRQVLVLLRSSLQCRVRHPGDRHHE
jgi:hypothetical protein